MNFRPFKDGDWAGIMAIERACFPELDQFDLTDYLDEVDGGAWCFVAEPDVGERMVGCIWVRGHEIISLAVLPPFRGQGVGECLLRLALEELRALHPFSSEVPHLDVRPSLIAAQRLYLSFGFRPTAYQAAYYNDGEGAIRMCQEVVDDSL